LDISAYNAFRDLKISVIADVKNRQQALSRIVGEEIIATEPALLTSYRLYGDYSRDEEITQRNRIRHPGFVPGGATIKVVSNA
jgi:prophage DNA circulation protein